MAASLRSASTTITSFSTYTPYVIGSSLLSTPSVVINQDAADQKHGACEIATRIFQRAKGRELSLVHIAIGLTRERHPPVLLPPKRYVWQPMPQPDDTAVTPFTPDHISFPETANVSTLSTSESLVTKRSAVKKRGACITAMSAQRSKRRRSCGVTDP